MFEMRVCLPIEVRAMGGMYTFVENFLTYLDRKGVQVSQSISESHDVLFVNSWIVSYDWIHQVKYNYPNVRVVQRVDGSAQDYGRFDDADAKQAKVNLLADLTIFQSNYSKHSSREKFRVIHQDGPVIYNPVDTEIFRPDGDQMPLPGSMRVCNVSWSTNIKKGTWQIGEIARENPDINFVLCGRYNALPDLPNICTLGHMDRAGIASALRSCQIFLNLSENDPCPNVVIEALASGLPVLYKDSGGVHELVGDCGVAITPETFRYGLDKLRRSHTLLSRQARDRALKHFSPDIIFPQYLDAMASSRPRDLPRFWDKLKLRVKGFPVLSPQTIL